MLAFYSIFRVFFFYFVSNLNVIDFQFWANGICSTPIMITSRSYASHCVRDMHLAIELVGRHARFIRFGWLKRLRFNFQNKKNHKIQFIFRWLHFRPSVQNPISLLNYYILHSSKCTVNGASCLYRVHWALCSTDAGLFTITLWEAPMWM